MLEKIKTINDVKNLNYQELDLLAKDIRQVILDSVLKNGGHLSSNLGTVELIIALAKVFDFETDKLIFDVGHQCYAYKILTGRLDAFTKLRSLDGISGFPKKEESKYDFVNSGHASTSLSIASGYVKGLEADPNDKRNIISIIGDGALTGGLALEALNNLCNLKRKQIIILNDNNMSISKNVGATAQNLIKLRTSNTYIAFKYKVSNLVGDLSSQSDGTRRSHKSFAYRAKQALKYIVQNGLPFEQYNLKYFGPINGHDIKTLCLVFEALKNEKSNILIHVTTQKGRGYLEAEKEPAKYHGYSPSKIDADPISNVVANKVLELAKTDERIYAISAAMISGTGLTKFNDVFPNRTIDVGIAEGHAVAMSAGLALCNKKPFVFIYSTFLQRAIDQIIHDVILQKLKVVFCVDRAGLIPEDGETHQGIYDIGLLKSIPNLEIIEPINQEEAELMVEYANENVQSTIIRYSKSYNNVNTNIKIPSLKDKKWYYAAGNGKSGIKLIVHGITMMNEAIKAKETLEKDDIDIDVINARFINPLDEKFLLEIADKKLFIFEDSHIDSGLSNSINAFYQKNGKLVDIKSYGIDNIFIPAAKVPQLLKIFKLDSLSIVNTIKMYS